MSKIVQITKEEYEELLAYRRKLWALEGAGVDNWEGYDYAMESLEQDGFNYDGTTKDVESD